MIKVCVKNIIPVLLLSVVMSGCESESGGATTAVSNQNNNQNNGSLQERVVSVADYPLVDAGVVARSELLTYRMPAVSGGVTQTQAIVLIPDGQPPADGWPVIGWGHQTTGVADACAPSNSNDIAGYSNYIGQFVQNGYAVVATDYEGLGESAGNERHPYLHLNSAGRSMLYAVRAAVSAYPSLSSRYALVGHSQGGHAALGAAELVGEQPDISLAATVAIAPPSNFQSQFQTLTDQMESGDTVVRATAAGTQVLFSALISEGIAATQPGFDQSSLYGSAGVDLLNSLASECISELASTAIGSVVLPLSISGNIDRVMPVSNIEIPEVAYYMASNEPGSRAISTPVMLVQGQADSTVFAQSTRQLHERLLNNGTSAVLQEYAGATHSSVVGASATDVLEYLNARFGR